VLKTANETVKYTARYSRHGFNAFAAFGLAGGAAPHSVVTPIATYSPWLADRQFEETFRAFGTILWSTSTVAMSFGAWSSNPRRFPKVTSLK
jgi:uncharacterized membrane protein YagU involved in acid resistance